MTPRIASIQSCPVARPGVSSDRRASGLTPVVSFGRGAAVRAFSGSLEGFETAGPLAEIPPIHPKPGAGSLVLASSSLLVRQRPGGHPADTGGHRAALFLVDGRDAL